MFFYARKNKVFFRWSGQNPAGVVFNNADIRNLLLWPQIIFMSSFFSSLPPPLPPSPSGVDMAAVLCKVGFSEAVVRSKMAAGTSTFVLAYAIHKLFAPARISITLVSVPLIVRYFRKTGLFRPRTPSP